MAASTATGPAIRAGYLPGSGQDPAQNGGWHGSGSSECRIRGGPVALSTRPTRNCTPHEARVQRIVSDPQAPWRDVAGVETAVRPNVVPLTDPRATDVTLVGAKAANLALARAAGLPTLPGAVLTTAWTAAVRRDAVAAWRAVSDDGRVPVVVRSSSTGEDGDASSMAGVFESILDVSGEDALLAAVEEVHASADRARRAGLVDAEMAVLVQPMLVAVWGGVLFGADPLTGRHDRMVVAAVAGGPDQLVSGAIDGWTGVLDRRGRVVEVRSAGDAPRPPAAVLRQLARLGQDAGRAFAGPQDVEWAVDADRCPAPAPGPSDHDAAADRRARCSDPARSPRRSPTRWRRSSRTCGSHPLRDGLREALLLTGTSPARTVRASELVIAVDGFAAADLALLGVDAPRRGLLRRFDPRPPARRLRAAWRVGRLRARAARRCRPISSTRSTPTSLPCPSLGRLDATSSCSPCSPTAGGRSSACTATRRSSAC